jgi:hypothetical protein
MMEEILGKEALIQVRLFESSHIFVEWRGTSASGD